MNDFWINFFANLLADSIIAFGIYLAVTQPGEKRKSKEDLERSLRLLRTEVEINIERAKQYTKKLRGEIKESDISSLSPLRYSRGAWNALKENDFFSKLRNPDLVYYLLRVNEMSLVANKNLRQIELAFLANKKVNKKLLAKVTTTESKELTKVFTKLSSILKEMGIDKAEAIPE